MGLPSSTDRVGWGEKGNDLPCPSTPTVRPARSRERRHSKSEGAGRLSSKDQVSGRLNSSVGPIRPKLVGVANRSECNAGKGRLSAAVRRSRRPGFPNPTPLAAEEG
jgi:hypothetical protein